MTPFLLDVNVLVALGWKGHPDHTAAQAWFAKNSSKGWATCAFTQAAFVRIVSNPAFSSDAVSPLAALTLLTTNLNHPRHQFWADNLSLRDAVRPFEERLVGHQQLTDAYLLGLAIQRKGKLATFDQSVGALFGRGDPKAQTVELITEKRLN
jgi:toxin-antitoxin system PIN domain toxin